MPLDPADAFGDPLAVAFGDPLAVDGELAAVGAWLLDAAAACVAVPEAAVLPEQPATVAAANTAAAAASSRVFDLGLPLTLVISYPPRCCAERSGPPPVG